MGAGPRPAVCFVSPLPLPLGLAPALGAQAESSHPADRVGVLTSKAKQPQRAKGESGPGFAKATLAPALAPHLRPEYWLFRATPSLGPLAAI